METDEPEAVPEGNVPGSSRGGTSGTVEGTSKAGSSSEPMVVDDDPMVVDWMAPSDDQVDKQLRRSKYRCKGDDFKKYLFASQLLLTDFDDWCGDVSPYCFDCSGWGGTERSFDERGQNALDSLRVPAR